MARWIPSHSVEASACRWTTIPSLEECICCHPDQLSQNHPYGPLVTGHTFRSEHVARERRSDPHSRASQLGQTYECVPQGVSPSSVWCTPRSLRCSKRTWIYKQHQRGGLPEVCPWRKNWRKVYSKFWKSRSICNKEGCSWRFEWVRFSPWMKSNRETGGSTWLPFLERWIRLPSSGGSCWRTETHIYRWS